jgi:hypothetical protein
MKNNVLSFSQYLFETYDRYRVRDFQNRSFGSKILSEAISKIVDNSKDLFHIQEVGNSFENRSINLIAIGQGKTNILFWSQMHGDESTATMAMCDLLSFISLNRNDKNIRDILNSITLSFLPMLNPDGAERFRRRTSQGIDLNRDAIALQTPEANILKSLQQKIRPQFGFNLHDQELSSVGSTKELSAIGLLAPASEITKSDNEVRLKAKQVATVFTIVMNQFIAGKVTKYDDSFEPRAFGDNMQAWGTSTLLVESGHMRDDIEKNNIRRLNFIGLLSSVFAIAIGAMKEFDIQEYECLPFNGRRAYDVIVRNVIVEYESGRRSKVDLGISSQVDTHSEAPPKLVDIGDLHPFVGWREIDGKEKIFPAATLLLNQPIELDKYF